MVFDNLISGKDTDYLDAYQKFIGYATSKNATFVTTMELVNMSISRNPINAVQSSVIDKTISSNNTTTHCAECDAMKTYQLE